MAKVSFTESQRQTIQRLQAGWELAQYSGFSTAVRIQEGRIGSGRRADTVPEATFQGLIRKGIIEKGDYCYPFTRYKLTKAGKEASVPALIVDKRKKTV